MTKPYNSIRVPIYDTDILIDYDDTDLYAPSVEFSIDELIVEYLTMIKKQIPPTEQSNVWLAIRSLWVDKLMEVDVRFPSGGTVYGSTDEMAKGGKTEREYKVGDKVIYAPNGKYFGAKNVFYGKAAEITDIKEISGKKVYTLEFKNKFGQIVNTLQTDNSREIDLDPDVKMAEGGETESDYELAQYFGVLYGLRRLQIISPDFYKVIKKDLESENAQRVNRAKEKIDYIRNQKRNPETGELI